MPKYKIFSCEGCGKKNLTIRTSWGGSCKDCFKKKMKEFENEMREIRGDK